MSLAIFKIMSTSSHATVVIRNLSCKQHEGVCGTVSSMLSGLRTRSLGLNTLGTT